MRPFEALSTAVLAGLIVLACHGAEVPRTSPSAPQGAASVVSSAAPSVAPADAGPPELSSSAPVAERSPDPGDAGACGCVSRRIEWGGTPTVGPYVTYTLARCRSFTKDSRGVTAPSRCTAEVACAASDTLRTIEGALSSPDVVAAFARAPVVFGLDTREVDGSILRVAVDGKEIFVGPDCVTGGRCTPTPRGVALLASLLQDAKIVTDDVSCP